MYRFVKANKETNGKYTFTCERNNFIGIISDEINEFGVSEVFTLSMNGKTNTDASYAVEPQFFDEYTPSEEELDEWLNYTEKWDKRTHDILEATLCQQKEKQLLPEINIDEMI